MNVNITGIYDNTVIVDNNLFEDVRLLQTGLSSLSDTLFNVVEGLPNQYANLTTFTNLSNDYETFKINNTSNLSNINSDIDNLTSNLSTLSNDYTAYKENSFSYITNINNDIDNINTNIDNNFVNNTTLSTLSTAIDEQFELTTTYIDDKITEQQEYTDQEIEALRVEGYIQEALTQAAAWITSDEGKRFRKKVWDKIKSKWASFTGNRQYTEFLNDASYATAEELDEMLKVYRYDGLAAGIRCDAITGKDIVMNGNTYIYSGNLHITGDINKGTFSSGGTWTQQKRLNDYFVMKGVKTLHCLDINNTTELLELHYDDLDFEQGPAPYYNLKLKYPIHSVHPTQCLSVDPTTRQLEFNINTDYFDFEANSRRTLKPKFDSNGVDDAGPLFIDFSTRKLRARYNDTLQVNASKELCTTFDCKGLKTGSVLSLNSTTKLLDLNYDTNSFKIKVNNELELKTGNTISTSINGVDVKLADTSLSSSIAGIQVSTTYKSELQQLKTDTETFKTQAQTAKTGAETAKTGAETARTGAETARTTATQQATIATEQAGIATTQATTATTQATTATTQATAAAGSASAAAGSASAASASAAAAAASAGAAGGSATAAAGAAAAAAFSALSFQKGDKGDKGDPGEPSNFIFKYPLVKSYEEYIIVPELSIDPLAYVENTTFSTFSEEINNKTNFSELLVSNNSTFLSSLNVSGSSYLNTVNVQGNLNVYGTTTIIDTVINNTTFNSFSVSGPSIYYSNVTLSSSLNVSGSSNFNNVTLKSSLFVSGTTILNNATTLSSSLNIVGNIIGSGTALTNLNYNAVTNKPDLSVYATSTNLNNLSTYSALNIPNLQATSTTVFNNLNSLSTNSILNITNLQATSTTTFNNLNSLSTFSILSINDLNSTSTSLLNKTNFTNLLVSGASTINSSLNVSGVTTLSNATTCISSFNVSGATILTNATTCVSTLTVSGPTRLNNITTCRSTLNVSGATTLSFDTTCGSSLNVSGNTTLNNATTINSSLNVVGNIIGSGTALTNLNYNAILNPPTLVSFNNPSTFVSTLNVSGNTTLNNATTINSSLNVVGDINTSGLSVFGINTTLSTKQNNLTFSNPFLNTSNTISLKYDNTKLNVDASGNLTVIGGTSQWTTTGTSIFYNTGKVGIGTTGSINASLDVLGVANIHNGTRYAILNYNLNPGSLIIGSTGLNYGGGTNWNGGNAAGLMMECNNDTEIVVHDNGNRLASLMYYEGNTTNRITIGRNMGWDVLSSLQVGNAGRLKIGSGTTDYSLIGTLDTDGATNTRIVISGNTRGFGFAGNIDYVATSTGKHLFYTTNTNQIRLTIDDNVVSTGYIYAGGTTSGLRINGNDYGNTIYQDAATIGGQPANIGFTLRNTNSFNFYSLSTTAGVGYTLIASMNTNGIALNKDTTITGKLNFPNTLDQYKINLWGSNNYGFGIAASTLQYSSQGNHSFYNSSNNANTFTITSVGNVSCTGDLTVANGLSYFPKNGNSLGTLKLSLGAVSGTSENTNMRIEIHGVNNSADSDVGSIIIRTYSHIKMYSQFYTVPQIFVNGEQSRVGLGTATPDARLHVTAGISSVYGNEGVSTWLGYIGMMNSSGVGQYYWGNTFGSICAIFDTNVWCKSNSMASSDIRIKKEIEDINDVSALEKILQIQPKTYKYIDTLFKKSHNVIGFIAQQIKEVIPEAVELAEEYIPNIYKVATTNEDIINLDNTEILKVNDDIKIYDKNGNPELSKIIEVNETSIKIDKNYNNDDVFIYGSKVDDFHTLDKSYIYTLNVCATQELYKLIQQQNIIIQDLQNRISILENNNI